MTTVAERRPARAGSIVALGLVVAGGALGNSCRQTTPARDGADARIAFYEARLGGRATYPAYAGLGLAYLQKGRETGIPRYFDDAKRCLLESQRRQRNFEAMKGLAAVYLARHEFHEALSAAEEAVQTLPSDPGAMGALFDAHLALGEDGKAAGVLDTLRRQSPGFLTDSRLSTFEEHRGRLAEARDAMLRACAEADETRSPAATRAWCRVRLGALFVATCEPTRAEGLYREALALFPGYYLAREHLAELAAARGRFDEAIAGYEGLLQTNPGPDYQLALADLLDATGEDDRAAALRATALTTLRDSAESGHRADWRTLGLLLLEDDATVEEGLRWAERDWENRRDSFAADTLAWAFYRRGRLGEAGTLITRALGTGFLTPTILLHAAEIELAAGRRSDAGALLQRLPRCREALAPSDQARAARLRREASGSIAGSPT